MNSLPPELAGIGLFPGTYFHVGVVVKDLDRAVAELGATLDLDFTAPSESEYAGTKIRVAYSRPRAPFVELVEGAPGSFWDTAGGPRVDHLGYFADDLDEAAAGLVAAGLPIDIDGRRHGTPFTYHRSATTGMRVELIATSQRQRLFEWILG